MALQDRTDAEIPLQNKGSLRTLGRLDPEATGWGGLPGKKQNYAITGMTDKIRRNSRGLPG